MCQIPQRAKLLTRDSTKAEQKPLQNICKNKNLIIEQKNKRNATVRRGKRLQPEDTHPSNVWQLQ